MIIKIPSSRIDYYLVVVLFSQVSKSREVETRAGALMFSAVTRPSLALAAPFMWPYAMHLQV